MINSQNKQKLRILGVYFALVMDKMVFFFILFSRNGINGKYFLFRMGKIACAVLGIDFFVLRPVIPRLQ